MLGDTQDIGSTKPYLVRALYEWCTDNGLTPYLAVRVGAGARVPMEFVKHGEIVLNISFDATSALTIGNDAIRFKARFSGVARDILVPIEQVAAIYARENNQGMAFPVESSSDDTHGGQADDAPVAAESAPTADSPPRTTSHLRPVESGLAEDESSPPEPPPLPRSSGSHLKRVK